MGIGEDLIRAGLITGEQLDEASRARVLYGGRLGTNMVELGHVSLDQLAHSLGKHHGLSCALSVHFERAEPELQRQLPAELAVDAGAVPLRLLTRAPRLAVVAFMDPPDDAKLDRIGAALGADVVPAIAPELRIRYQLEFVYGHRRTPRYMRIRRPTDELGQDISGPGGIERRRYAPNLYDAEPAPPPAGEPPNELDEADGTLARIELQQRAVPIGPTLADAEQIEHAQTVDDALRGIRRATDRDRVVELVVSCMRDGFGGGLGAGLFLLVREQAAIGWRGFTRTGPGDAVNQIAIPLEHTSVLQLSYRTRVLVVGAPPPGGARVNERLWALLGAPAPASCVVAPVLVQERVVCLMYAHASDFGSIAEDVALDLARLAEAAGAGFLRLIRAANR